MSIPSTYPNTKTVSTSSLHQMVQIYLNPEYRPHDLNQLWRPRVESFVFFTRKILLRHSCCRHLSSIRMHTDTRSDSWSSSTRSRVSVRVSSSTSVTYFLAMIGTSSYAWVKSSHVFSDSSYPCHLINTFTVPSVSNLQSSIDSTRNLCRSCRVEFWTAWDTYRSFHWIKSPN